MDVVKNCKTGVKHMAPSGSDYTLCSIWYINSKCHPTEGAFDKKGNYIGWEEICTGKSREYARKLASCKTCKRNSSG